MKKFRILKKTYGSGAIVFIPQWSYLNQNRCCKNVCDEMWQAINSFETEEEARKKINEYKKYLKDSEIILEEVIQINDDNFIVGQKLFCVDSSGETPKYYRPVKENHVYTIREITPSQHILLEEIVNPPIPVKNRVTMEIGYKQSRFKLIENLK